MNRLYRYLLIAAAQVACAAASAEVVIEAGYVRAMPPGVPNSAAFMTLRNSGDADVVIDGGSSDVAGRVEIHNHVHEHGMMSMRRVDKLVVPAGASVVLEPGGFHLMLFEMRKPLKPGDTVNLVLSSGNKPVVDAELPVQSVIKNHHH